ncbi:MAG: M14 family metallopeptidase [Phycisphaeraceae bacterium]|nr:MAG: M14 family metallopeptidase [Phycisphaeraceae bacterium]
MKTTAALCVAAAVALARAADPDPITVAESSHYTRTGHLADVNSFLQILANRSPLIHLSTLGQTFEHRDIPLAIIADPPVTSPDEVGDRLAVLLFGSIHAGEICGTEALQMLARDLIDAREAGADKLLDKLVVCLVPVYNADGHERFAPDNRPGQNGPEEMGIRANAQGLDLNRDWVKLDAPETRAMVAFLNTWDPPVIVDTHTTDGSNHRFTMTYQGPKHPAGDKGVIEYVRDVMLPDIDQRFEAQTGYHAFFYGNFEDSHTKWTTYPAEPWYGTPYRGIRNRVSILTEAYAYASFEDRVKSTHAFCREILRYAAANATQIRDLVRAADKRTIAAGRDGAPIALQVEAKAFPKDATILGYDEPAESGAHGERAAIDQATTPHKNYELPIFNDFEPTLTVDRPAAYLIPASFHDVIDRLRAHGIRMHVTPDGPTYEVAAGIYKVGSVERADHAWQGRTRMDLVVALEAASAEIRGGDVIVPTDQPLGSLAAYLLEPRSTGGLVACGFFEALPIGSAYPIARLGPTSIPREILESGASPPERHE